MNQESPGFIRESVKDDPLATAPRFCALASQIAEQLRGKDVVIYNVEYDDPLLRATLETCGQAELECAFRCAMRAYAAFRGHRRRGYGLAVVCRDEGISMTNAHRALGDCLATLAVLHRIAERAEGTGAPPKETTAP
jgi:DNA polymerase-3 subunit epsilon